MPQDQLNAQSVVGQKNDQEEDKDDGDTSRQKEVKDDDSKETVGVKPERKIVIKVESIEIKEKTEEVIGKLRRLNSLYTRRVHLTSI